jgi:undecaprenyl-diphosphatase
LGYAKVAVLGVIQGITELLPISSTAHMRVVPALLGWQDPGSAFSAAMQLAALTAVVTYFWSDVRQLVFGSLAALGRRDFKDASLRLSVWIVIGTIPIVLAGLALSGILNTCTSPLRALSVVGWACLVMALLLALAELSARHLRTIRSVSLRDAVLVGLAQVGALIPGVSRSGSTLTAALALGFKREEAARFSFLLGLPAIALAGLKELWELHKGAYRRACVVGADRRTDCCIGLRLCGDLDPDVDPGALLRLAVRDLSRAARCALARRASGGMVCLIFTAS